MISQHWNLHPAGWPILFCGPTQKPVLATANTGKNRERFWKKMRVNGAEGKKRSTISFSVLFRRFNKRKLVVEVAAVDRWEFSQVSWGPVCCLFVVACFNVPPKRDAYTTKVATLRLYWTLHYSNIGFFQPRSGELRTQKLKSHLVRTQSLNVLPFKPGVGQYIAIYATLTAREFFLAYFYPSSPFTCIFFQNLSRFFPVLALANTGSCVGPQNKIGHPAGCRFPCWVPAAYK